MSFIEGLFRLPLTLDSLAPRKSIAESPNPVLVEILVLVLALALVLVLYRGKSSQHPSLIESIAYEYRCAEYEYTSTSECRIAPRQHEYACRSAAAARNVRECSDTTAAR
jgi:hypothetical protein